MKIRAWGATLRLMSKYIVAHVRKVATGLGMHNVAKHNERIGAYAEDGTPLEPWITHPEFRDCNELHSNPKAIEDHRAKRIAEAALKRKPYKNAARAVEVTISASNEWFEPRSTDEVKVFLDAALESVKRRYGAANVIGWSSHYDETAPHLHVLFVPLVEGKDGLKYSSSEFVGSRADLAALHDHLARDLAEFGVVRGERGSEARHTDQREWQRELKRQERELAKKAKELAQIEAMWAAREAELAREWAALNKQKAEVNRVWAAMNTVQQEAVKKRLRREDREDEGR